MFEERLFRAWFPIAILALAIGMVIGGLWCRSIVKKYWGITDEQDYDHTNKWDIRNQPPK